MIRVTLLLITIKYTIILFDSESKNFKLARSGFEPKLTIHEIVVRHYTISL